MAVQCPKCKKGNLKVKKDKMVYCENYKPHKNEKGEWINEGSCDFRILLDTKMYNITTADVKNLLEKGEIEIKTKKGDKAKLILDLNNEYNCRLEFEKEEDEFL